ncbi:MAG: EAL domain-containing protein [Desulfobacterales bacterium]|nr:EAL domain-containing protein [Desulfobacterales bacterium]
MDVFQFTKTVLEQTDKGMIVLDHHGVVRYATPLFFTITGFPAQEVGLRRLEDLCMIKQGTEDIGNIFLTLAPMDSWQGELVFTPPEHREKQCAARVTCLQSQNEDRYVYIVSVQSPAGSGTGTVDELTGLPGVEIFLDRVEQSIRFSRREKSKIVMFLIRLDRFDLVTDGLGHEYGDRVLKEVSIRLRKLFRESDTIARIDRITFGLLLKVTKEAHASLVAEKVLQSITGPIPMAGQKVVVTASIGIATCHNTGDRADKILGFAETAMHHARQSGGNVYHFFASDLNVKAKKRIEMENSLRAAIEEEEFILYYQPKVDISTSRIVGAEALIRWQHPEQGMVAPFHFIPVAEETGLIIDIGRWVLKDACRQNARWQQQGLNPVPVAVNVSPRQFQYPGFYDDVKTAIRTSGLDPDLLELEITESMLMSDVDQMIAKLKKLAGVGLNLAIDDFGTGYSNLSYLVRFPVSTLKIDRTFIKDLENDDSMAGLTHSIISMSKNLNLKIVAEGAENEQHISFLKKHGCDVVQGYYYSKPVPAADFSKLLETGTIKIRESSRQNRTGP